MRVAKLLINAEARARLGDVSGAVAKLNAVRSARGAQLATTGETQQQVVDDVLLERRRELWGEGFSLIDIIRNQQSVVRKQYPYTPIDYTYSDANGNLVHRSIVPQGHRIIKQPDGSNFTANTSIISSAFPAARCRHRISIRVTAVSPYTTNTSSHIPPAGRPSGRPAVVGTALFTDRLPQPAGLMHAL
jgi:hypothetical protein